MNKSDVFAEAEHRIVSNSWDLPSAPQEFNGSRRYHGPDYQVQERIKKAGRLAQESKEERERLVGYVLEAYGHYYRSEEAATNQSRKHPMFEEYVTHWFYSAPDYVKGSARRCLRDWLDRPRKLMIVVGKSIWRYRPTKYSSGRR